MDELIADFLVETKEGLDVLDSDLMELEKNPDNKEIISNLFRVMHTIKGTCGFLGLARLERVAHAGEDVMDKVRSDQLRATADVVSIILEAVDHIKILVGHLEQNGFEENGDDSVLVNKIKSFAAGTKALEAPVVVPVKKEVEVVEEEKVAVLASDSTDLQALFDATPCLVDISVPEIQEHEEKIANTYNSEKEPVHNKNDQKKHSSAQTIRVGINVLEELMQNASELVLVRNQLLQLLRNTEGSVYAPALQRLNNITTELQEGVMKTRMQPVGNAWTKLPRIVRDLAIDLRKKIELKMKGEETELDRQLLEMIADPLTHMVRNSADHGIEMPEIRKAAGKPEAGTINVMAYHGGGYIIIEISDDGNGINPEIIKKKAIEKGLVTKAIADEMSKSRILQFIFAAGFSTAEKITSVSGRGVGMDVVKNNIEKISGTVDLDSEVGKGSKFTIRIPLTLAIMPVLKISIQNKRFAIPQINVREVVKAEGKGQFHIESLNESSVLRLRGSLLPLVELSKVLGLSAEDDAHKVKFIIVCESGNYTFGIIVDNVHDTEEIVVKPVSPILKSITIYSGSTILGDGSVVLILDPNALAKASGDIENTGQAYSIHENKEDENLQKSSFVIFHSGDSTPKIAPLELISRLEEIDVDKIEHSGGVPVVQYRGELMRLISIDPEYKIPTEGVQEVLVVSDEKQYMGLMVKKIIDILKATITKKISGGSEGFMGSLVIDGKACDVVDISYYFKEAFKYIAHEEVSDNFVSKKHILFVDDSPFFRKFIPPELEAAGYFVTTVASGADALKKIEDGIEFFAIVTDMTMPGMSGQEFVHICRQKSNLQNIPIIALSANRDGIAHFEEGKFNEIDAFVAKTNHGELLKVLSAVIAEKENA